MELLIFYFLVAIVISFICSILESVLLTSSKPFVSVLQKNKPKVGELMATHKSNTPRAISSILILNTIAHTVGAAGVGSQAEVVFGSGYMGIVSVVLTLAILFLSEIIPKTIGTTYFKELAPISAYGIKYTIIITYPILILTQVLIKKITPGSAKSTSLSKEELAESASMSNSDGILDSSQSDVIKNIIKIKDIEVGSILTPRSMLFALNETTTVAEAIKHDDIFRYSRIPVFSDNIDNINGIILGKELFKQAFLDNTVPLSLLKSKIYKLNEHIPVDKALSSFIKRKEHLFLVEDSYGQTEGIVALEDCIETILGVEIVDESDEYDDLQIQAKSLMKQKRKK